MTRPDPGRPLRVLVLASFFPKPGNPTMGVWALRQAQGLRRAGAEVLVVSLTPWVPRALAHVVPARARPWAQCPPVHVWDGVVARYPRWPRHDHGPLARWGHAHPEAEIAAAWPFARRAVARAAGDFAPDVVHAQATGVNGLVAARLHAGTGVPFVVHEHDTDEVEDCRRLPGRARAYRSVAARAQAYLAPGRGLAERIEQVVPGVRVRVIPNGADLPPAAAPPGEGAAPPAADGPLVVLAVARLFARKGVPALVEAFARVAGGHPRAVLRIVGDGPERDAVVRAVAAHGLAGRVELLGYRPHAEVLAAMAAADVFVLPGWEEPFGVVVLEALAAGTPAVCPADAGVADVLADGTHALLVPPRDVAATAAALDRLLGDRRLRARLGAAGAALVRERLTWDHHGAALRDVLAEAAGS